MGEVDVVPDADCPDCLDEIGPPPDGILSLPPPPLPYFIQLHHQNESSSCNNHCIWAPQFQGVEFVELSREEFFREGTWVFIIGAFFLGLLLLVGLVTFLFLNFRSRNNGKSGVQATATASAATASVRSNKGCESVFYPCSAESDARVLWATLTPTGTTQHYTAPNSLSDKTQALAGYCRSNFSHSENFQNACFVDSDSQTPLMESYQLHDLVENDGNFGTLRKFQRPKVSSPTRIENPNLPPLNLHPLKSMRRAALQRKDPDLQCSTST